jgi:hypothetical protein
MLDDYFQLGPIYTHLVCPDLLKTVNFRTPKTPSDLRTRPGPSCPLCLRTSEQQFEHDPHGAPHRVSPFLTLADFVDLLDQICLHGKRLLLRLERQLITRIIVALQQRLRCD